MATQQDVFTRIRQEFQRQKSFDRFLDRQVLFQGRRWHIAQFLYKYFYDRFQAFAYQIKDHPETISNDDKPLAENIRFIFENKLVRPIDVFEKIASGTLPKLDIFGGNYQKELFYQNLFTSPNDCPDNPCYWPPVSRLQTRFIESRLMQMGMSEKQIKSLMLYCAKERQNLIAYYQKHLPKRLIHNTRIPPDQMEGHRIKIKPRTDDQGFNLQKFCFVAPTDYFHSGLPLQDKEINFLTWPRFRQDITVFHMTPEQALDKISVSYNYRIDMKQKKDIFPVIPLWGGKPQEWIAKVDLTYYPHPRPETFGDLLKKGKKVYLIPDRQKWKIWVRDKIDLTPKQAESYLDNLAKEYPNDVIRLDENFARKLLTVHNKRL